MTAILLALLFVPSDGALADIPPPEGYVESCTVDKQATAERTCAACHAWYGEHDACSKTLGTQGFVRVCKTHGASSWNEVWCKPRVQKAKPCSPSQDLVLTTLPSTWRCARSLGSQR